MVKFSVIIPIYNVAPYLRECLNSVLAQTDTDWEAICVDDGSTDASGAILDKYAAKDARFKVIHQQNAGVGAARNRGLDCVGGEWVFFLDADDILYENCLKELCRHQTEDVDIQLIKYKKIAENEALDGELPCNGAEILPLPKIDWDAFFHPIFAACFRRAKYERLRFEGLSIGEDRLWYVSALDQARKVVGLDYVGYGYRVRTGSAIHSKMSLQKFNDNIRHFSLLLPIMQRSSKTYSPAVARRVAQSMTEYASMEYVQLPQRDRRIAFLFWMDMLRTVRDLPVLPAAQRWRMKACLFFNTPFVALAFCYIPYWLKVHGVRRWQRQ